MRGGQRSARWPEADPHRKLVARGALDFMKSVSRRRLWLTGVLGGVALAGGFARGIAHIGVLRVLRDEGIPIDAVAGAPQIPALLDVRAEPSGAYQAQSANVACAFLGVAVAP